MLVTFSDPFVVLLSNRVERSSLVKNSVSIFFSLSNHLFIISNLHNLTTIVILASIALKSMFQSWDGWTDTCLVIRILKKKMCYFEIPKVRLYACSIIKLCTEFVVLDGCTTTCMTVQ